MDSSLEEIASKPGVPELIKALTDIAEKIERRPRLVGAIANPQTTHDTFYAMLFGEVDDLLFQIKGLETTLANANQSISDNLVEKTAKLEAVSREILAHLQELLKTAGATASAKMKEAREVQENDMRLFLFEVANKAVSKAVGDGISELNASVKQSVSKCDEALGKLEIAAARSEQKVRKAVEAARPGWSALIAGVTVLSALLGGVGGFMVSRIL